MRSVTQPAHTRAPRSFLSGNPAANDRPTHTSARPLSDDQSNRMANDSQWRGGSGISDMVVADLGGPEQEHPISGQEFTQIAEDKDCIANSL